ncbi:MAG: DUF4105 domain-containing protein [Desulforhopalus sp.]
MPAWRKLITLVLCLPLVGWGALALYYSSFSGLPTVVVATGFVALSIAVLVLFNSWKKALATFVMLFAMVLMIFFLKKPSNDREWQPDLAILPYASMEGDNRITLHNIRNCDYRSESDFTVQYYNKTFDLDNLTSVDLYLVDWGLKHVAHTMLSFGFNNQDYIAISIEARKERGESYSTLQGFFRQYELTYVVADERDLIRLRTNYRQGETVYLYRVQGSNGLFRQVFLDYFKSINRLRENPEWYNALLTNCTTQLRGHTRPYYRKVFWDWRLLANGYVDELAYEVGTIDNSIPFAELKKMSVINSKAMDADQAPDFSQRIRDKLPGMKPGLLAH